MTEPGPEEGGEDVEPVADEEGGKRMSDDTDRMFWVEDRDSPFECDHCGSTGTSLYAVVWTDENGEECQWNTEFMRREDAEAVVDALETGARLALSKVRAGL